MKKVRLTQKITSRENQSIKKYLEEIREIGQLTVDEEYEIALQAKDNTLTETQREAAITKLITKNLRFVVSVAKQYVSQENSLEDLVNEGNHGLIYAARRYDPTKGFKFITYAVWWIRRDIYSYINKNARLVRLPNNKLALLNKLKEVFIAIEQHLERSPSVDEVMEFTGATYDYKLEQYIGGDFEKSEVDFFLQSEKENSYSFDKPVQEEDSQTLMSDLFEDHTYGPADQHLINDDSDFNVSKLLANLKNDREREVITMLYGLDGREELSIKDISLFLNISRERVRQIKVKSINLLKSLIPK